MTLRPCPGCRRHVRDEVCPFCGAMGVPSSPRPVPRGRLSRAAVFAGVTLAGCWTPPPAQPATPPPDEHVQQQREPAPPPAPPKDGAYAKPPVGITRITGVVATRAGRPMPGVGVGLSGNGVWTEVETDGAGRFEFRDLRAGTYTLTFQQEYDDPRSQPTPLTKKVSVANGATEQVNVVMDPVVVPVDHGPCCKPYGAPPARRRVV